MELVSWALRSSQAAVALVVAEVEPNREDEKAKKRRVGGGGGEGLGRRR